jgi:transposase
MCTLVSGSTFVEDIFVLLSSHLFPIALAYLNPNLVLLQTLCLLFDLIFLFVRAMTHVGTEAFCFLALSRRFFLDASLFLPKF